MMGTLWLIPVLPLAGFAVLALAGRRLPRRGAGLVGAGSVGLAALLASLIGLDFLLVLPPGYAYTQTLWTWFEVSGLKPGIAFFLDPLALVMVMVITWVGFLIHLYSVAYMEGEEGYGRFFAAMNLFVASMLILVLADNMLLLYLGWEGVGLCSYLLIGFRHRDPGNGQAARKAFVVTRVGDVSLALGIFLLTDRLGTFQIQGLMTEAVLQWPAGSAPAVIAAFLILGGALGKSAQLPLQTWLPDAMAGPTPVSALIHAATMVTAGVYLIARTNVLFTLAPAAGLAVAVIGAFTLLMAACSALVQRDIKRVLAYSTISQIGYMFLALGVGAWGAAIFHFMVHAFFKSLLFLAAGAVALSLHHERDIFRMGGLRQELPLTFWTFLIGSASLSALPLVTAGFYSKELILWRVWSSPAGGFWLWLAGLTGAFLTSLYAFRVVFLVFFGPLKEEAQRKESPYLTFPLIVLALLSLLGGFVEMPHTLGGLALFSDFLGTAKPAVLTDSGLEFLLQLTASAVSLGGIYGAYFFFLKSPRPGRNLLQTPEAKKLRDFWFSGWGFDGLYDLIIVRPFLWLARVNRNDGIDLIPEAIAGGTILFHRALSLTQSGRVRWYAAVLAFGAAALIALVVLL